MKTTRRVVQFAFLALTIGAVFLFQGNAEQWCPFGGVEAIYTYFAEGNMLCSLGVTNFYILGAVLLITLLTRRAFCGYMCPVGTLSEWLQRGAVRIGIQPWSIPPRLDRTLALLKYPVLAVILFLTWRAAELIFRGFDPCYALISRHGEDITLWAYVVAGMIVLASLVIVMPFCRWLCPLAAVLNPFSRFGLTRIKRDDSACLDCGMCARVCPMAIPVDKVSEVTAARCLSCMNCVEACPGRSSGAVHWGPPRRLGGAWPGGVVVVVLLCCTAAAIAASYLAPFPSFIKTRGEPSPTTATVELHIHELSCRGRGNLLMYYLERDDMYELSGYLKLEAWPGPGAALARVTYNPSLTDEASIKEAVTEPYFDREASVWRPSPFAIEGYDPFGLDD
jgi:Pyruvate/2-oxoacid:ferredoxin oxidoreductase delta subunit